MKRLTSWAGRWLAGLLFAGSLASAAEIKRSQLPGKQSDLPPPGESTHQTGSLTGDVNKNGLNDSINRDTPRVDGSLINGAGPRKLAGIGASFKGPLGLQLYSLRHHFAKNVPLALEKVRDLGFTTIEGGNTYNYPAERYLKMLDAAGLKIISVFTDYQKLRTNTAAVIADANRLGAKYVICGWIPHPKGQFSEQHCRAAIATFNNAGEKLAAAGLRFAYHPHGFEFAPHGDGTLFDLMVAETKPEFVAYELDVFWAAHGGADPVQLLKRYPKRFELMHIKDWKKGAQGNLTGGAPDAESVAVGEGQVDWPSVLKAAQEAGLKHYFIEDEALEAIDQIPRSLRYLEQIKF